MSVEYISGSIIKNIIAGLNRYLILQLTWVIAVYYFVLNSLFQLLREAVGVKINLSNVTKFWKLITLF
ncbi:hypothetical protein [Anaerocellum danielii]|uniref:Uncharacterized protein n=1 Tax=Anaerocellum danielii TaxID=1387557 RepID=A0ABZ0TZY6_9FIRM|nr:hypothetical protein [Caldicellulosiruptor danielii]WPX07739.1 hypothetical protein SOJ16_001567 [Caldicellulosiruptor danielii]